MARVAIFPVFILLALSTPLMAQVAHVENAHPSLTADGADPEKVGRSGGPERAAGLAAQAGSPAPNALLRRRRGSMVGYIDDPVVSSKIRLRFESALHNRVPDRAEFFYGKCGCYRDLNTNDPAYDPDASGPAPGIATDLNFQQVYVHAEYAATDRFSAFAELPIRWLQPKTPGVFGNQSGLSDLRAGVKFGIANTDEMSLTAQVKTFLASGDSRLGLGTGHASIEPGLLYHRDLSDRAAIATQLALWIPFGGSDGVPRTVDGKFAGSVLSYGIGPSVAVYTTENVSFAPVVELVGWRVLNGYQTADPSDASGTNIVNLKLGARAAWANGSSIYGGYGLSLTDDDWYDDIFRFEYRLSF